MACHHEERSDVVISFLDWQLAMQEIATGQKPLAMTLDFRICLEFGYWYLEFSFRQAPGFSLIVVSSDSPDERPEQQDKDYQQYQAGADDHPQIDEANLEGVR
jgi:hypothetical protein